MLAENGREHPASYGWCLMRTESVRAHAWPAYAAAALAFAYAAVSFYWGLGGTALLDTVGGEIERLTRSGGAAAFALAWGAGVVKVLGGVLALALVRPWGRRVPRQLLLVLAWAGAAVLILYGGTLVVAAALVEADVLDAPASADHRALRWHLWLWDMWFLVWGVLLALAAWQFSRHPPSERLTPPTSR